ncbi:MAG TPA: hypothetical protein VGO56_17515 [Pyrinomonadaceae bacterium]|jgi:hypothetical protein|nr:hypothetical protein [Pyrinomonadaceae bacterium]
MKRNTNRQATKVTNGAANAIREYVSLLNEVYPPARGKTRVVVRQDNRVIVNIPLPTRAHERMRLFDQMAEVGTRLLLETDQHIILSGH